MMFLFVVVVALIGSAVGDDQVLSEESVQRLVSQIQESRNVATVPELVTEAGYSAETHHVVTEDGYILEMHRISGSPISPASEGKPVAFLMHGLLCSSAEWIIMGPQQSLGYILADAGYDVWMGNARGNTWSKDHTENLSDKEYWQFSWHEIGIYDLPAMIDYALTVSGEKQLVYIGHSQGTTSFYVMATQRTEYNDKIKAMFSLAPVAYMGNLFSPVLRLAAVGVTPLSTIMSLIGWYEFMPSTTLIRTLGSVFCDDDALSQVLCSNVLFLLCGFNKAQLNTTTLPTIFQYTPAGAATRQLIHYGQEIRSDEFRQYDLGRVQNKIAYDQWSPPTYDLSLVTAPVHLIYGDNDWMAAVKDVTQLYNELGNPIEMYRVPDPKWNHLDFLWGIDAKPFVFDHIIETLENRYNV